MADVPHGGSPSDTQQSGSARIVLTLDDRPVSVVLASSSPRRHDILHSLGIPFSVVVPDVDERPLPDEAPAEYVTRLAVDKAQAAAAAVPSADAAPGGPDAGGGSNTVWIAADTTVVLDGAIVGKPADPVDASNILSRMQGQRHEVLTGIAVLLDRGDSASTVWASDRSEVTIRPMSSGEVAWYVATGEPLDKAGAYGLQGIGAAFVEKVVGTPTNVIGLPVPLLFGLIDRAGLRWRHTA